MRANESQNRRPSTALKWWNSRRFHYNLAVGSSGLVALIASVALVWTFQATLPEDAEVTLFTIAFQLIGFLCLMVVANICYFVGPLSERLLRPSDVLKYRETAYALGFWFSVALPFAVPALVIVAVIQRT
jgi:hypothetical protein